MPENFCKKRKYSVAGCSSATTGLQEWKAGKTKLSDKSNRPRHGPETRKVLTHGSAEEKNGSTQLRQHQNGKSDRPHQPCSAGIGQQAVLFCAPSRQFPAHGEHERRFQQYGNRSPQMRNKQQNADGSKGKADRKDTQRIDAAGFDTGPPLDPTAKTLRHGVPHLCMKHVQQVTRSVCPKPFE